MILVMNKKHGVGCSLLTYSLGRLFNLPIYVDKGSFMLDEKHYAKFPPVSKITASNKRGIFDIGANLETRYTKKFIQNAKLIIIPFEYGYESMISTIQTLKYIEFVSNRKISTVLILNRLDKKDDDRDFNYTRHMKERFTEEGINFSNIFDSEDTGNLYLTYLRNSYSLQSNLEYGEYFLDKMYNKEYIYDYLNNLDGFRNGKLFDYRFFMYLADNIISSVNYKNEDIYIQDKDMVVFRNGYSKYVEKNYPNLSQTLNRELNEYLKKNKGVREEASVNRLVDGTYVGNKERKLIKDMAYIAYMIDVLYKNNNKVTN